MASGLLFTGYRFGHGRFFINTFPMLENLDINPAADRMLLNIIRDVQQDAGKPLAALPKDFHAVLDKLYHRQGSCRTDFNGAVCLMDKDACVAQAGAS